ncbi:MAG TPA: FAD-dependent oxidoreductase [Acidimicrobiales bacterium]|nr:FAD-dependent oxidoreductase [Acidimicrobiales bacterium]
MNEPTTSSGTHAPGRSLHVAVIGAGIGGLGAALAFSRQGHRVTLIERDDTPMPDDVEGAFEWQRRGAPQVRHPHAFLGLARTILRDRFPDVLADLLDNGVHTVAMGSSLPGLDMSPDLRAVVSEDDLQILGCRRTTFEWVLRRSVLAEQGVDLRVGTGVSGLVVADRPGPHGVPAVAGVQMEDASVVGADLVIASTGRRSDLPSWLAAHGIDIPETTSDAGVVYFSRFYRNDEPNYFGFRAALSGGLGVGVIGADAGTYSITAVVDKEDKELRSHLNDSDRFDATMRLMPEIADVIEFGGKPIHPVHLMTGLINRIRTFTDKAGDPRVTGVLAVGDAHTCTNPAYGRGQSLALLQATLAADSVRDADDLLDAARRYEAASAAQVEPWYHFSVMTDQMRAHIPGGIRSKPAPQPGEAAAAAEQPGLGNFDFFTILTSGFAEPELLRVVLRVMNLLDPPHTLLTRLADFQRIGEAARQQAARRRRDEPRPRRVTRDELLAVVA